MNLFSDRTLSITEVDEASSVTSTSSSSSELSLVLLEMIVEELSPDLSWGLTVVDTLILTTFRVGGGL